MLRYRLPRMTALTHRRPAGARLLALAVVALLACFLWPASAVAARPGTAIKALSDVYALLNADGSVVVTGPLDCAPLLGQTPHLRVTLSQPGTGALAEATWSKACTGDLTRWSVTLPLSTSSAFQLGPAESGVVDYVLMHQWISMVTLVSTLPPGSPAPAPPPSTLLLAQNATLGPMLTDWRGFTVYTFANDAPDKSTCSGDCAATWSPVLAPAFVSVPVGTAGVAGMITRDDGTSQLTYNHQPLYLYQGDVTLSDTNGQEIGGVWRVVTPQAA